MADDRERLIRELHEETTRPEWRALTDIGFLLGLLDEARAERDRWRTRAEGASSLYETACQERDEALAELRLAREYVKRLEGLVEKAAARPVAPMPARQFLGHAPGCDCSVCVGARGAT